MASVESFHTLVREERHFCAVLAHLLMERGGNLTNFVALMNEQFPGSERFSSEEVVAAEIYVEFTMLRDSWNSVESSERRAHLIQLMRRVPRLRPIAAALPSDFSELNALFAGARGAQWTSRAAYPGQWSVAALRELAGSDHALFRELCRFKWSFNIKPDLVILAGGRALCVEAKLESSTSSYPSSPTETRLFNAAFGRRQGRVGQLELQRFMFDEILELECSYAVIARDKPAELRDDRSDGVAFVSWRDAFRTCDLTSSIPFVRQLLEGNHHL